MGEYADYNGSRVKIGTCEDLYYLRWDQREKVSYDGTFDAETLAAFRFRFPFPDEDEAEPGSFEDYDRGLTLWGFEQPDEVDHGSVQFTARNGYLTSLPCPEGPNGDSPEYVIHKNGYGGPAALVQQGWRGGRLVGIVRCNGCGARYRLDEGYEKAAAVAIRSQADKQAETNDAANGGTSFLHTVADRLLAGYGAVEA